jgi:hypothetical protein
MHTKCLSIAMYTQTQHTLHTHTPKKQKTKTDLDVRVPVALQGVKSHGAQPIEELHRLMQTIAHTHTHT